MRGGCSSEAGAVNLQKQRNAFDSMASEYGMEEEPVQSRLEDTFMMLLKRG